MPAPSLSLHSGSDSLVDDALASASGIDRFGADVPATLEWCRTVAASAPRVGEGNTRQLWETLAATAALSVSAARMLEPHLDALTILRQADSRPDVDADDQSTWGVFAAEGPGMSLEATAQHHGAWQLSGTKPWCSLGADLSHALVTASIDENQRQLFAVSLRQDGVDAHRGPWVARGLADVVSAPITFDGVRAVPVGDPGWYLTRPGFAWGGMSVAACWWGAAVGVAVPLRAAARSERADQLSQVHLGNADVALWSARAVLDEAAGVVDGPRQSLTDEKLLAARVRAVVAESATRVLSETDAALGPAPLVSDDAHARRVADLHLYLRQHHGPRDIARIGRDVAANEAV
ncbi:acyl-CoA dehydrogenase (plasmid) [Coraliomargarita sp. W4R53]